MIDAQRLRAGPRQSSRGSVQIRGPGVGRQRYGRAQAIIRPSSPSTPALQAMVGRCGSRTYTAGTHTVTHVISRQKEANGRQKMNIVQVLEQPLANMRVDSSPVFEA